MRSLVQRLPPTSRVAILIALTLGAAWVVARMFGADRISAPRPEAAPDLATTFVLPSSTLTVPVRVHLATLIEELEEEIPREWGDLEQRLPLPDSDRATVAVVLQRSPFSALFTGATAQLSTTVAYGVRGWLELPLLPDVSASCGTEPNEPRPRLDVSFEGPVALTPDWRLSTATRIARLAATSDDERDRCEVTFAGIDVTGSVVQTVRSFLEENTVAIDSLVGTADLRGSFEEWWDVLREPIGLGADVWLELRPSGISQGPVGGEGDVVEIIATLTANPRVVLGTRPPSWPQPLPRLAVGETGDGLDILVEAIAEYGTASRSLSEALGGLTVTTAGRRLQLDSFEITGIGGNQIALEVQVSGDIEGRLFLVGTPVFDPATNVVSVPDLAFSISTSNLLVSGASWIGDAGLEAILRERAYWPVESVLAWAADRLREGLNRELTDGVSLEGTVESLRILGVAARRGGLVVGVAASADATLTVADGG